MVSKIQAKIRGLKARKEIRSVRNRGKLKFISSTIDTNYNFTNKTSIVIKLI